MAANCIKLLAVAAAFAYLLAASGCGCLTWGGEWSRVDMIIVDPEPVPAGGVAEITVLVSNSSGTGDVDTELVGYTVEVSAGLLYHSPTDAASGEVTSDESRSIGGGTDSALGFGRLYWAAPDAPQAATITATYRGDTKEKPVAVQ